MIYEITKYLQSGNQAIEYFPVTANSIDEARQKAIRIMLKKSVSAEAANDLFKWYNLIHTTWPGGKDMSRVFRRKNCYFML